MAHSHEGAFTWENSHRREFHTGMTFLFRIVFTLWLGHFISRHLKVHFMLIKYTCDSKSQTLRMRYPFQSTGRPISHRNGWSFRVYMIPLRDFVPEWNSRPGARTGVNSRRGDSRRHNMLCWYHVNKYRAMRGNRSELTPGRKSPRCHVNTPWLTADIWRPLPLVFPPNDLWETSAEFPYWCVTTQIWLVLLIGRAEWEIWFNQSEALTISG